VAPLAHCVGEGGCFVGSSAMRAEAGRVDLALAVVVPGGLTVQGRVRKGFRFPCILRSLAECGAPLHGVWRHSNQSMAAARFAAGDWLAPVLRAKPGTSTLMMIMTQIARPTASRKKTLA
jgi:hypothetical protein